MSALRIDILQTVLNDFQTGKLGLNDFEKRLRLFSLEELWYVAQESTRALRKLETKYYLNAMSLVLSNRSMTWVG